ncbi:DUF3606 domain-containing protein [Flavobacterium hungaricum]|uniref:DUF3606 domain-containing protein n=1 Tax=Flavobacterium hungaricum TaxID=2082725 RepID=A0ABR9TM93_9FLAO|nr:DUF3606 domain-containing protein [Flavobacterium hungaricum]MBE8726430.1 DUF3606 domain-containing protein [Flavobacterium hungaricum]
MEDNNADRGKADDANINISEPQEIQYWSEKLNVPEEVLKNAVRAAGTSVEDFSEHLTQNT